MKICGIICELNPAHKGHKYLVDSARKITKCDKIIAIMSGNYVQRGEPAIYEYRARAKMALNIGFDAVVYMPTAYTLTSADNFAKYGVEIAKSLNLDYLAFGSNQDIDTLHKIANFINCNEFNQFLKDSISSGISYAKAFGDNIEKFFNLHLSPNDILGLQYVLNINKLDAKITPIAIPRDNPYSATTLRQAILDKNEEIIKDYVNQENLNLIKETTPFNYCSFNDILYSNIISKTTLELSMIKDIREGLEYKISSCTAPNLLELNNLIKTKRYNQTYLNRLYLNILFGIKNDIELTLPYIKVIAVKDGSTLRKLKCDKKLITDLKDKELLNQNSLYNIDSLSNKIYNIISSNTDFSFPFHKLIIHSI